jgi:hypothetical protein
MQHSNFEFTVKAGQACKSIDVRYNTRMVRSTDKMVARSKLPAHPVGAYSICPRAALTIFLSPARSSGA